MFIETHAHLYFHQFDEDRDEVINRALAAGVKKIINIGTDLDTSRQCIEMAEQYPELFATVGIHPNDCKDFSDRVLGQIRELAAHPKVVAIGEIGLDFYRDWTTPAMQERAFRTQINFAKEIGLPIVIHNREAGREILDVLRSEGTDGLTGVFHCFSENREIAEEVLAIGFYVSFTGNLTFKKSELPEVAKTVPPERLLLETDCPFLSPEPKRGRRNEPANIPHIAERLAAIKGIELTKLAEITTLNAYRLFGLGD